MGKLLNQFYVITYSESYSRSNADIPWKDGGHRPSGGEGFNEKGYDDSGSRRVAREGKGQGPIAVN